jgi:hypothetical protein
MKKNTETLWTGHWSQTKKITGKCSEDVLLDYFLEKSEKYSAASQWTASSGW